MDTRDSYESKIGSRGPDWSSLETGISQQNGRFHPSTVERLQSVLPPEDAILILSAAQRDRRAEFGLLRSSPPSSPLLNFIEQSERERSVAYRTFYQLRQPNDLDLPESVFRGFIDGNVGSHSRFEIGFHTAIAWIEASPTAEENRKAAVLEFRRWYLDRRKNSNAAGVDDGEKNTPAGPYNFAPLAIPLSGFQHNFLKSLLPRPLTADELGPGGVSASEALIERGLVAKIWVNQQNSEYFYALTPAGQVLLAQYPDYLNWKNEVKSQTISPLEKPFTAELRALESSLLNLEDTPNFDPLDVTITQTQHRILLALLTKPMTLFQMTEFLNGFHRSALGPLVEQGLVGTAKFGADQSRVAGYAITREGRTLVANYPEYEAWAVPALESKEKASRWREAPEVLAFLQQAENELPVDRINSGIGRLTARALSVLEVLPTNVPTRPKNIAGRIFDSKGRPLSEEVLRPILKSLVDKQLAFSTRVNILGVDTDVYVRSPAGSWWVTDVASCSKTLKAAAKRES
jgi:DNA-binding PadR family transcriptional regulator